MKKALLITLSMASFAAFGQVKSLEWQVKKTSWNSQDEKNFQDVCTWNRQGKRKKNL